MEGTVLEFFEDHKSLEFLKMIHRWRSFIKLQLSMTLYMLYYCGIVTLCSTVTVAVWHAGGVTALQ